MRFSESISEKLPEERFEFETHHLLENQVLWMRLMFTSLLFGWFGYFGSSCPTGNM